MKILLINGGKAFAHSGGELNNTLHGVAVSTLTEMGYEIRNRGAKLPVGRHHCVSNAGLVDGRALDCEALHR